MASTVKSPFIQAMDSVNNLQLGENGSAEYTATGVKESRVALFFALVRDIPSKRLRDLLQTVLRDGEENEEVIADLFLMTFQTRHCRGGKGERDLFYAMIMFMALSYPETTACLMEIIPHYGSYLDWFRIIQSAQDHKETSDDVRSAMVPIVEKIMILARDQLLKDKDILESGKSVHNLSLLAKWAPREGKAFNTIAKDLAKKVFPGSQSPKKEYRKLLSRLNAAIDTVEVKMSSKDWDAIRFQSQVPSVCLMKNRKAFLNEVVKGQPPKPHEDETGNRHPHDESRVNCRKRLRAAMLDKSVSKLKGKQLFPHQLVEKLMSNNSGRLSTAEKDVFSCQWNDIRKNVIEAMRKNRAEKNSHVEEEKEDKPRIDLGNMVSLVDVSGSMSGTPMNVAIALGLLVSEIASPAYSHRCLTFSSRPTWVELNDDMSLDQKVKKMKSADWGMNTDFEIAMEQILKVATDKKLKPEEIPNLIVFSDMQFDQARCGHTSGSWETHHERIVRRFKEEGMKVCGEEWPAPHMIYWNLRGSTTGFPAQADTPGVTMLSGYSPSLMKLLLDGEPLEEEEDIVEIGEDGVEVKKKAKKDPFSTVRKALDSEDYDQVRERLYSSQEGVLLKYIRQNDGMDMTKDKDGEKESDEWDMVAS